VALLTELDRIRVADDTRRELRRHGVWSELVCFSWVLHDLMRPRGALPDNSPPNVCTRDPGHSGWAFLCAAQLRYSTNAQTAVAERYRAECNALRRPSAPTPPPIRVRSKTRPAASQDSAGFLYSAASLGETCCCCRTTDGTRRALPQR